MNSVASPSPARLLRLLEGKPSRLERYLVAHPEAEAELERLSSLPTRARELLSDTLATPVDLADRLRIHFAIPQGGTDTQTVVMDLLGLGWQTAKVLIAEPDPE